MYDRCIFTGKRNVLTCCTGFVSDTLAWQTSSTGVQKGRCVIFVSLSWQSVSNSRYEKQTILQNVPLIVTVQLALCKWYFAIGTVQKVLCNWHCEIGTVKLALCNWYCAIGTVQIGTVQLALCKWYFAICTVQLVLCNSIIVSVSRDPLLLSKTRISRCKKQVKSTLINCLYTV